MQNSAHRHHKHIHPLLSYAFLVGAGVVSLNSALTAAVPMMNEPVVAPVVVAKKTSAPSTLESLKSSAAQFSVQLGIIKSQVSQLSELGYPPPSELTDAIGEGEQLISIIGQAQTLDDLGDMDAGTKLEAIGSRIRANSKY